MRRDVDAPPLFIATRLLLTRHFVIHRRLMP